MFLKKVFQILVLLLLITQNIFGQYFLSGTDHPSLRWMQMRSKVATVIYPVGFDSIANDINIKLLENISKIAFSSRPKPRSAKLILHPYSVIANGWVAWAPARTEYILIPPAVSYPQPWFDQLVIHESRHHIQIDRLHSLLKPYTLFFGEQFTGLILGLQIPVWFLEGDAVCSETELSQSGRGRYANFLIPLKAQLVQKGRFSYHKAVFGSYIHFVPNHYQFGYEICAALKARNYLLPESIIQDIGNKPFNIRCFYKSIKTHSGNKFKYCYREILDSIQFKERQRFNLDSFSKTSPVFNSSDVYYDYSFPYWCDNSNGFYILKQSFIDIPVIEQIENGRAACIIYPGFQVDPHFSVSDSILVWSEIQIGRFEHHQFSDIFIYNVNSHKKSRITKGNRYFAPSVSCKGNMIAAIRYDDKIIANIDFISLNNNVVIDSKSFPAGVEINRPSFSNDASSVVFIKIDQSGKSLVQFNIATGKEKILLNAGYNDIDQPVMIDSLVYFLADHHEKKDLFAIDTATLIVYQLSNVKFGVGSYDVNQSNKKIIICNYSYPGYSPEFLADPLWNRISALENNYFVPGVSVKSDTSIIVQPSAGSLSTKKYRKIWHLINIHSWNPVFINVENDKPSFIKGIKLISQNDLSTCVSQLSIYQPDQKHATISGSFEYGGLYLILGSDFNVGLSWKDSSTGYSFNKLISTYMVLPLISNRNIYIQKLQLITKLEIRNVDKLNHRTVDLLSAEYGLRFSNQRMSFKSQIAPKWAQYMGFSGKHSLKNNKVTAFFGYTNLFFPGFGHAHGLNSWISLFKDFCADSLIDFQQVVLPRGFYDTNINSLMSAYFTYFMPLIYPEKSIPGLFYLKRVKMALFYDWAVDYQNADKKQLASCGTELTADCHFFHWLFPFDLGWRFGYKPMENKYFGSFVFSINVEI